jgi:hypothetical protein
MRSEGLRILIRSGLLLFLGIQLFLLLSLPSDITPAGNSGEEQERKPYPVEQESSLIGVPAFSYAYESMFDLKASRPVPVSREPETAVEIPVPKLNFVGVIQTADSTVYSFKEEKTNRILLLQEGSERNGYTLLRVDGDTFLLRYDEIKFEVKKK